MSVREWTWKRKNITLWMFACISMCVCECLCVSMSCGAVSGSRKENENHLLEWRALWMLKLLMRHMNEFSRQSIQLESKRQAIDFDILTKACAHTHTHRNRNAQWDANIMQEKMPPSSQNSYALLKTDRLQRHAASNSSTKYATALTHTEKYFLFCFTQ